MWYETMIFNGGAESGTWRSRTREEAIESHVESVVDVLDKETAMQKAEVVIAPGELDEIPFKDILIMVDKAQNQRHDST